MLSTIRNLILIFLIMIILGFSLMVLAYMVPTENAYTNFSHENILSDGVYPYVIPGFNATKLDVYTDSKILSEVSYYNNNDSLLVNAMSISGTVGYDFNKFIKGDDGVLNSHSRYWGGYLVILKPLFYFINYNSFKFLEIFFGILILIAISKQMLENNLGNFNIPFLISIFLINPEAIFLSLQYSTMFNIMTISVFFLLKFKDTLFKNNRLFYYFLIVGMATSYFDLLTYPLISFAIPMIFYLLLEKDKLNTKETFMKIVLFGIIWCFGYIGMWASKWVIASIILKTNVVSIAIYKLFFRTSATEFSGLDAILRNLLIYKHRVYLIIFGSIAIYYLRRLFGLKDKIALFDLKRIFSFILISIIPFVWYFIVPQHSYIHSWFTYRELLIFFFAIMCSLELIIMKEEMANT